MTTVHPVNTDIARNIVTHLAAIAERVNVPLAVLLGPTAELVRALPEKLPRLLAADPRNGVSEQAGRQGDQFPIHSDVQFVTVSTHEVASRHPIAA
jgi:hypothetical protein